MATNLLSKYAAQLLGTNGNDYLASSVAGTLLKGGLGNDRYFVISDKDVVEEDANGGYDVVVTYRIDYRLGANVENLEILGDKLSGTGNAVNNVLTGGAGRQTLIGLEGNDTLTGGGGDDIFVMTKNSGHDTITDFSSGDIVRLGAYGLKSFDDVLARFAQVGKDAVLKLSATDSVTFKNVDVKSFTAKDFQYSVDLSGMKQTFADEFDSLVLQDKGGAWRTSFHDGADGRTHDVHAELQYYMEEGHGGYGVNPFKVENGVLTIHGAKAASTVAKATGYDYTSGMLSSRGEFSQQYGYFEIRAEVPAQTGTWPAFWLLPAHGEGGAELDVFEQIGSNAGKVYTTMHSSSTGVRTGNGISSWVGDAGAGMHTYGLMWTKTELVWYVDGAEVYRLPTPADMHQPMYMITNLAIGGDWPGSPDAGFQGADYKIDYIRAYQFENQANAPQLRNVMSGEKWSMTLDTSADDVVLKGTANINATGNARDNVLTGNDGNNTLDGREGADTMSGGKGDDTYVVDNAGDVVIEKAGEGTDRVMASISYKLTDNVENLILTGTDNIDGTGNALDNVINGNAGNNVIDGGAGADTMAGGKGDDTYYVDHVGDVVTEYTNEGTDTIYASVSYSLTTAVENLFLTGKADLNGTGNWLDNKIVGNDGNNVLNGGSGADTLIGGKGDDTYVVDNAGDVVIEKPGEGIDTVQTNLSNYRLGAHLENLVFTGSWGTTLTGNELANHLTGNVGNDTLDGGIGADTMAGGIGNDTYVVDDIGDVVIEKPGEGVDRVMASVSYKLTDNVEELTLTGVEAINGTGNALANVINGNAANNILDGGAGADTMAGGKGDDTYYVDHAGDVVTEWANEGTDTVYASVSYSLAGHIENLILTGSSNLNATGNWLDNRLVGNAGNNVLDGGSGVDTMEGGAGDDTYYVDNLGDVVIERANEGIDTVYTGLSNYKLGANIENLVFTGAWGTSLFGNELNNRLTGNVGGDTLDGGLGADTMLGGLGNDTYIVDDIGDVVIEKANEGIDRVLSSISYKLTDHVENLVLSGSSNINGTGNDLANSITGNSGNNIIDGGVGADNMAGGKGDDIYYVDNVGDVVQEYTNEGIDTVYSTVSYSLLTAVENLILTGKGNLSGTGNWLDNKMVGNDGDNFLSGGGGNDTLIGGAGNDTLSGGTGSDVFIFGANSGNDIIVDFGRSEGDRLDFQGQSYTVTDVNGSAMFTLSGGGTIVLTGVSSASLNHVVFV